MDAVKQVKAGFAVPDICESWALVRSPSTSGEPNMAAWMCRRHHIRKSTPSMSALSGYRISIDPHEKAAPSFKRPHPLALPMRSESLYFRDVNPSNP